MKLLKRRVGLACCGCLSAATFTTTVARAQDAALINTGKTSEASLSVGTKVEATTTAHRSTLSRIGRFAMAPANTFITVASFADRSAQSLSQDHRGGLGNTLSTIGNQFGQPRVMLPALGLAFLAGKLTQSQGLSSTALDAGKAFVVTGLITQFIKMGIGRGRPDSESDSPRSFSSFSRKDENHSFPSGHTATAVALATTLALKTDNTAARIAIFSGAALTAFGRLNDNRHWLSDILAGAALGFVTAKVLNGSGSKTAVPAPTVGFKVSF